MKLITFIVVLITTISNAISQSNPDLQAMVDAERGFINMAREQNRRDAFLFFLSDSAVTQGPQGPVKGKVRIQQQKVTNDLLHWEVAYSDIAASGDFGFNTGPWEFRADKADEKPTAFGEFNSIWKKMADGSWKNVLDIGISHQPPGEKTSWSTSQYPLTPKSEGNIADPIISNGTKPFYLENDFLAAMKGDQKSLLQKHFSMEAHLMFSGHLPFRGINISAYLNECPEATNLKYMGGEMATSRDMCYVYGIADVTATDNEKPETKKATFVRVWKQEHGSWKIVLDVLTF